jgi:hypothetical protein
MPRRRPCCRSRLQYLRASNVSEGKHSSSRPGVRRRPSIIGEKLRCHDKRSLAPSIHSIDRSRLPQCHAPWVFSLPSHRCQTSIGNPRLSACSEISLRIRNRFHTPSPSSTIRQPLERGCSHFIENDCLPAGVMTSRFQSGNSEPLFRTSTARHHRSTETSSHAQPFNAARLSASILPSSIGHSRSRIKCATRFESPGVSNLTGGVVLKWPGRITRMHSSTEVSHAVPVKSQAMPRRRPWCRSRLQCLWSQP